MSEFERWGLLSFFLIYFLLAFVLRSVLVWRRTGINPYKLPKTDDAYGLVTAGFRKVIAGAVVYLWLQALWPPLNQHVGAFSWLDLSEVRLAGWIGLTVSILWLLLAQAQMGLSWRIGIDDTHATALVTKGLFGVSRNPIFLAMRLNLFCLFLLQPNGLTLTIWLLGDVLMQFQVRLEEAHLERQHGANYQLYRNRVHRWL